MHVQGKPGTPATACLHCCNTELIGFVAFAKRVLEISWQSGTSIANGVCPPNAKGSPCRLPSQWKVRQYATRLQALVIPAQPTAWPAGFPASPAPPRSLRCPPSACQRPCDPPRASRQTLARPRQASQSPESWQLQDRACAAVRLQWLQARPTTAARWSADRCLPVP